MSSEAEFWRDKADYWRSISQGGSELIEILKQDFFAALDIWWEQYQERYHRTVVDKHEAMIEVFYSQGDKFSNTAYDWLHEWEKRPDERQQGVSDGASAADEG